MPNGKKTAFPDWFLWIVEKGFVFWMTAAVSVIIAWTVVVLYVDDQLDDHLHEISADLRESEDKYLRELRLIREDLARIERQLGLQSTPQEAEDRHESAGPPQADGRTDGQ